MRIPVYAAVLCAALSIGSAGCRTSDADAPTELAVTNSYLESVVADLLGDASNVLCLTEPGMCPGHFDIRPGQVARMRTCRLLLRFDFQSALDAKLAPLADDGLAIAEIRPIGGLSTPKTYLDTCRQAADALGRAGFLSPTETADRLTAIARRMAELDAWARDEVNGTPLAGRPVLTSVHQQAFCEWLGLPVTAAFRGADTAGVGEIESAVRAGAASPVAVIVANRPEGRRVADALADRLDAPVVVLDNFPDRNNGPPAFDALVRTNVKRLIAAGRP